MGQAHGKPTGCCPIKHHFSDGMRHFGLTESLTALLANHLEQLLVCRQASIRKVELHLSPHAVQHLRRDLLWRLIAVRLAGVHVAVQMVEAVARPRCAIGALLASRRVHASYCLHIRSALTVPDSP
eukprot:364741-Chlamydomonas_euryale.AAC.12